MNDKTAEFYPQYSQNEYQAALRMERMINENMTELGALAFVCGMSTESMLNAFIRIMNKRYEDGSLLRIAEEKGEHNGKQDTLCD